MSEVETLQAISSDALEAWQTREQAREKGGVDSSHHSSLMISVSAIADIGRLHPVSKIEEGKPGTVRKNRQRSRQRRKVAHVIGMEVYKSEISMLIDLGLLKKNEADDPDAVEHAFQNLFFHAVLAFPTKQMGPNAKLRALRGRFRYMNRTAV